MSRRQNILFILTDQQHASMMSCTGNQWLKTPAMDSLAANGTRFENAYCTNPVCLPSRTSMATGVMSCRLGVYDNASWMKALPPAIVGDSMGMIMRRAGYDTFHGGKVHMPEALAPMNAGYDEYYDDERNLLAAACLTFIKKKRENPFFAVASFINPHDICFAHRARNGVDTYGVLGLYKKASSLPLDELPPLPENFGVQQHEPTAIEEHLNPAAPTPAIVMRKEYDERAWRIYRWMYHRLTEQVDTHIGALLDGLKESGLEDNTVIIFASDHGDMDASHRLASKFVFYEESVGVPLIIQHKNSIPAGKTDRSHLVSTGLDLLPTICDYAGVEKPPHLLGKSFRSLAEVGRADDWRSYVVSENGWGRMIRSRRFKYCVYDSTDSKESLVDLESDPGEMRNLVDVPQFQSVLAEHRRFLADWSRHSGDNEGSKYMRVG